VEKKPDTAVLEAVGLTVEQARHMHRLLSLGHFHERFVVPTTHRELTDNAPYIERGFSGFREMTPSDAPRRRRSFHGKKPGVGS
jgi:nitrate reductase beta subunit